MSLEWLPSLFLKTFKQGSSLSEVVCQDSLLNYRRGQGRLSQLPEQRSFESVFPEQKQNQKLPLLCAALDSPLAAGLPGKDVSLDPFSQPADWLTLLAEASTLSRSGRTSEQLSRLRNVTSHHRHQRGKEGQS